MKKLAIGIIVGGTTLFFWGVFDLLGSYDRVVYRGSDRVEIIIPEGSGTWEIAKILQENRVIRHKIAFVFGVWRNGLLGTFHAGVFEVPSGLTPREVALYLSQKEGVMYKEDIRITFPEGWTAQKIAERLEANGFDGEAFSLLVKDPDMFSDSFVFLQNLPEGATLEGFLFPDTYLFDPEASAETIVRTLLSTFEKKMVPAYEASSPGRSLFETLTLASIIEGEVRTTSDRRMVSGIFQTRLDIGMALQSDATLTYVMEEKKIQHDVNDLEIDSPYNTYKYPGLPPGPVSNPSLDAFQATLDPQDSDYLYFLNNPETGETYFAVDFEEHKRNKMKAGL